MKKPITKKTPIFAAAKIFFRSKMNEIDEHENIREKLVMNLFKLFIQNKWTLKSLEDTAKLMNSMPGATLNIPTTKYLLIKELMNISKVVVSYHFHCVKCDKYTKCNFIERQRINKCSYCDGAINKHDFFVSFNLKEQIATIIDENFSEIRQFYDLNKSDLNISDVHNSCYIRDISERNENIYSLTLNTDGVAVINSNTTSLWPVMVTCNFLPPDLRFKDKNILVAGLYFGNGKPNMHELLRPLAEELKCLSEGIFVREMYFNIFITNAALDLPAKSDVSKLVLFNSQYACNFCLHKGESTPKGIRYTYKIQRPELRTHGKMIRDIVKVDSKPNIVIHGIKGISPMIAFKHFDLAKSFPIDYMHAVLLGVTKKITGFWTDSKYHKEPFYINKMRQSILNQRLLKIKTPSYISRRPRSLKNAKKFKASELRSLLLFYLPIVTKRLLPKKYIDHFMLLSSAIYTLLQPSISNMELNEVEKKLEQFVCEYEQFYGKVNMTMNVHSLLHLVYCVRNFGPLWAFSMFPFESFNGTLKSFVVAPTDILHQITSRYLCYKAMKEENEFGTAGSCALQNEIECSLETVHIDAIQEADLVCLDGVGLKYFLSYRKNKTVFTSKLYTKAKCTENFFIETLDGELGAVELYVMCNGQSYAMLEKLHEIGKDNQFKKINFSKEYHVIKADQIMERYIHIEVMKENYLIKRPNKYERN